VGRRRAALAAALAVLAALCGCPSVIDRFVFFPSRLVDDPPEGVAERWLGAQDGTRLHAWLAIHRQPRASLVWSHGNGGNISDRAGILLALAARGFDVLAYDYRGYGKSEGAPSEAGVYLDAEAAFDAEVRRGVPASRIVCFGESLGGAVSIHLATRRPCAAVVVVSTFTSLRDVARRHYGPLAVLAGDRFDSESRVGTLSVPFFAAHGDRDEVIPYQLGERLFAVARDPKRFVRVPGAHHNDVFAYSLLFDEITAFVSAHVRG
jgi:fermentation-respiration switch protein FrsA (DUF1100 family)